MAETDLNEVVIGDEPLTSSNYEVWKVYMQNFLSDLNLWGIVNGTESGPDEVNTWMMKNEMALNAIKTSCGPEIIPHLEGINSAKEAWDQLASMKSSGVEMVSSTEDNDVVLEIQHDDDADAGSKMIRRSPQELSDGDRSDAVPEIKESFLDAMKRFEQTVRNAASGWSEDKPDYIRYRPLYTALVKGDWETAKEIIEDHPEGLRARITSRGETALHAAVISGEFRIVKKLLKLLPPVALEAKNASGDTAILLSASDGTTDIAKLMVEKNNRVLQITNGFGAIPLVMSIHHEKEDMTRYLYSVTPKEELDPDKSKNGASFLAGAINAEMFGLCAVPGVKDLQKRKRKHVQVLELLKVICSAIGHMTEEEIKDGKVYDAMGFTVAKGNIEVFMELIDANPSFLYTRAIANDRNLYHRAVIYRQENIFNFISAMGQRNVRAALKDKSDNNLLHYAGRLPLSSQLDKISGAALQMQREIQWFQEVEKIVEPKFKEHLNKDGKTPAEVFTEEHKALKKDGEAWMKETANACMLVSALIATVMFAAAYTVPGGNDQSSGTPLFLNTPAFTLFIVSDAISLFASCTSILMFFSILTARYAEQDFLKSLPQRLIIGLASLFISIATMMAAFGATLVIVLRHRVTWAYIPVTLLASVPVVLFGLLQFPLFVEMVRSTYGAGIFTWQKVYLKNMNKT